MEVWRDIPGFEGYYEVSDAGRVRSLARSVVVAPSAGRKQTGYARRVAERVLKAAPGKDRRQRLTLWKEHVSTQKMVHQLVLLAFVGPCPEGMEGCHGDGDASNNQLGNLRWDTPVNNSADKLRHGTHLQGSALSWAVLTEVDIPAIFEAFAAGETQTSIAARYGVQQPTISRVLSRKRWAHVT